MNNELYIFKYTLLIFGQVRKSSDRNLCPRRRPVDFGPGPRGFLQETKRTEPVRLFQIRIVCKMLKRKEIEKVCGRKKLK